MEPLAPAAVATYWNERHRNEGDLRSGGNIAYDEATNEMFYTRRLALLLDIVGPHSSSVAPLRILDAGCGKGWFSRRLAAFGHEVDAIDQSINAIGRCQRSGGGPRYATATLAGWRSPRLYDVVLAIDVLFHVLDHDDWAEAAGNLASLVRLGGRFVASDWGQAGDRLYGNYQLVRGRDRYGRLAREHGLRLDTWRSYDFRSSPIGFYVFTRVA